MWPATMGYWMETMMAPVLGHDVAEVTRQFFTRFVSGAGPIPAIRAILAPFGNISRSRARSLVQNALNAAARARTLANNAGL